MVPKLVPRAMKFDWYWYRLLTFWYCDNRSMYLESGWKRKEILILPVTN